MVILMILVTKTYDYEDDTDDDNDHCMVATLLLVFVLVLVLVLVLMLPLVLEPETISIIADLLGKLGSFGILEWVLVAHVVALIVVNVTETPEDNRIYGKLYKLLIEPLALGVGKAKQSPKQGFK